MNLPEAMQIVNNRWITEWGVTTPFRLDNEVLPVITSPWASLTIIPIVTGRQHTLGPPGWRKFERKMILFVEIHTPTNGGTTPAFLLVQKVTEIFEGWRSGELRSDGEIIVQRQGVNGVDYIVVVEVSFIYYETK